MEPLSLIAIAVAFAVALFSLSRAAAARRELAAAHEEIALLRKQLPHSGRSREEEEEEEEEEEPEEEPEAAAEAPEEAAVEPEVPAEPTIDPAVVARANEILRSAKALAQHIGFDHEVKVGHATGVRVAVPVEDEIDESAIAHLRATSPAVLDVGERDDERFLIIRR
jgi:hypothetical protein